MACGAAHAADIPFMPVGSSNEAPRGFLEMCQRDATFCAAAPAAPATGSDLVTGGVTSPVRYQAARFLAHAGEEGGAGADMHLLRQVNRNVNQHVRQRTDDQVYGRGEYWQRSGVGPQAQGDCEDLAIEKRYELIAAGFDPARLRFAVAYLPSAGLHAVLLARLADGDFVLDSRTPYISRWDKTRYSWVSIQSERDPMHWYRLGSVRSWQPQLAGQPGAPAA
ncbi:transglutaminase-like cysteine peptidase [Sphingomonas morindae]|uniref:Transglutaminase-like cysteine peptidase n=1 Tax=Sphingomonas morindae TaxID=1541170 RepID=A0ABY4X6D9_9SPHN|nr:transglutaminase-like cysteine peptidase [Sphingomonas morindae]USI72478.1 transglutaminase-like cysteine peptidase [Sphingomonas morindae]